MVEERTKALRHKSVQLEQEIERRKIVAEKLRESESRYRAIFESTGTAMMIVGEDSTIHLVNAEFEKLSGYSRKEAEGALRWTDLLSDADIQPPAERRGAGPVTVKHYECQAVDKYGQVRDIYATAAEIPGTRRWVVSLLDVTERKRAVEAIGKREEELAVQNRELTDLNTALKVLLKKREEDRREMEERVADNIRDLILPHLSKLRKRHPGARERSLLNLIESNLKIVISPSTQKLSARLLKFTPKEIQVANLIKAGRTTKEIAEHLDVSKSAIDTHRHHIRNKLGLKKKKVNLRSYLHSLE
jgi:PAS domain S-box-containing protein